MINNKKLRIHRHPSVDIDFGVPECDMGKQKSLFIGSICVELLRAQKYVVRRQCDNIDVWTVPYNGSSSIIFERYIKKGWVGRLWFVGKN